MSAQGVCAEVRQIRRPSREDRANVVVATDPLLFDYAISQLVPVIDERDTANGGQYRGREDGAVPACGQAKAEDAEAGQKQGFLYRLEEPSSGTNPVAVFNKVGGGASQRLSIDGFRAPVSSRGTTTLLP